MKTLYIAVTMCLATFGCGQTGAQLTNSGAEAGDGSQGSSKGTDGESSVNADSGDGDPTEEVGDSGSVDEGGEDGTASDTQDSEGDTGDDSESGQETSGDTGDDLDPPEDSPCGWQDMGRVHYVTPEIQLCLPPTLCNLETCQADLGTCTDGKDGPCAFADGYDGLRTLPEAWATHYCVLDDQGGCLGTLETTTTNIRQAVRTQLNLPYCYEDSSGTCLGIVAFSPMMGGNSRMAKDGSGAFARHWGLGLTPASGLCYEIEGLTGHRAIVAVTDRCAGYCDCGGGMEECGNCLAKGAQDPDDVTPSCPCVGDLPSLGSGGEGCPGQQTCDWCMSNNHPHFDLDDDTFKHICDADASKGSCKMKSVRTVECMTPTTWPCPEGAWFCFGSDPFGQIPGTYCCQ